MEKNRTKGTIKTKNVPKKSGKSPKGEEIKKSTIQNVDFLIRGGGRSYCQTPLQLTNPTRLQLVGVEVDFVFPRKKKEEPPPSCLLKE